MSQSYGVAVFGCGGVSAGHFSAYATNPRTRLVAAVDVRPELAQAAAEKWGAQRWYSSVAEALADPETRRGIAHAVRAAAALEPDAVGHREATLAALTADDGANA